MRYVEALLEMDLPHEECNQGEERIFTQRSISFQQVVILTSRVTDH